MEALPQLSDEEFEQIEEAIARTAKGRAFLRRSHRRAMGAATEEIRGMLAEFRQSWHEQSQARELAKRADVLRRELMEMAASIEQARREVAALRPPDGNKDRIVTATSELDAIVISTERASFEILNAAEKLMDLSSRLRADGAAGELCSQIENEVTNIFTACSFQDLTGQRTSKVVGALRYIEQRINAMMTIWGEDGLRDVKLVSHDSEDKRPDAHLLNGPALEGQGVSQADVDSMFGGPVSPPPVAAPAVQSQADIDSLFDAPKPSRPAAPSSAKPASQSDIDDIFNAPAPAVSRPASQSDIDSMFDAPAPAASKPASQSDIDSMFDAPTPAASKPAGQSDIDGMFDAPTPAASKPASQSDIDSMFDAPTPAASKPASQSDIDSMFDAPTPAAAKPAAKVAKPPVPGKAPSKPAPAKPAAKPVTKAAAPPEADAAPAPLDQSAIDALFG